MSEFNNLINVLTLSHLSLNLIREAQTKIQTNDFCFDTMLKLSLILKLKPIKK
jgi:hypothetical protein